MVARCCGGCHYWLPTDTQVHSATEPDPIFGHRWVWGRCQCGEVPVSYIREDTESCDLFQPREGAVESEP